MKLSALTVGLCLLNGCATVLHRSAEPYIECSKEENVSYIVYETPSEIILGFLGPKSHVYRVAFQPKQHSTSLEQHFNSAILFDDDKDGVIDHSEGLVAVNINRYNGVLREMRARSPECFS